MTDFDQNYNTTLSAAKETEFATWKQKYAPKDSGDDYDLRGAFKAGLVPDPQSGHWPDTYKKPSHPTFSDQSRYASYGHPGHWDGDTFVPPTEADTSPVDISASFQQKSVDQAASQSTTEMESWLASGDVGQPGPVSTPSPDGSQQPARPATPQRRPGTGPLGTPEAPESSAGYIMRSFGEIVPQASHGINDAVMNATSFVAPLADWLDQNVVDLTIKDVFKPPKTVTGGVVKSISQFLTAFLPLTKGLAAIGATAKVGTAATALSAGAISDFMTRNPQEGRLADLWVKADLPKNVLTDYLRSKPDDTEMEARFKNALESAGLGLVTEGILQGARAIRAMKPIVDASKGEQEALEQKYGKISDEEYDRVIGDPSKPVMETKVHQPPVAGQKIMQAAEDTAKLTPKSVIRVTRKRAMDDTGKLPFTLKPITSLSVIDAVGKPIRGVVRLSDLHPGQRSISADRVKQVVDDATPIKVGVGKGGTLHILDGHHRATAIWSKGINATETDLFLLKGASEQDLTEVLSKQPAKGSIDGLVSSKKAVEADFEVSINFNRIDAPDKVKFLIGKTAEAMKGNIDEATRGVITHEETQKLADDLGMSVTDLLSRRKGQPLNAEEAVAARNIWAASGTRLLDLAKKAASPNAGALDQFEFRKAMAVHAAIQNEVIGARTETARALSSWNITAKGRTEQLRAIDQTLEAMGGPQASQEMARRLAILAETGGASPALIGKIAQKGWGAATADAIKEAWVNGLLTNPATHAVNTTSNTLVAFQQIYERGAAAGIRQFLGGSGVAPGEATAMAFGMVQSLKDAFRMAGKAMITGKTGLGFNKVDIRPDAISADAFKISKETGMGRAVDMLGHAVRVPGRLLQSEDEFFKTIGYRMELHAQALRTASQEGFRGRDLAKRVAEIVNDPPEFIRINSADAAMYNTFTNPMGEFGKAMMNLRNIDHPLNPLTFIIPFIRTPVNISRYAFERTPFAPLVSQWRADIAAGGARADLALSRMATGTAIMTVAMDYADSGLITGGGPTGQDKDVAEAFRRQGIPPYSFKAGDKWYSYNRLDPMGMTMGFAASIAEAVRKGEVSEDDVDEWNEVAAMSIAAVAQVTINKTYLSGFANFVEVMSDPQRYSQKYINDMVASFVPFVGLSTAVKNAADPVQREANTPWEAVQSRIAGLSDKLPPRRNLWGEKMIKQSGFGKTYDMLSPVAAVPAVNSPIDRELVRLNAGPLRITKKTPFNGVRVNLKDWPQVYDDYTRLAGNDLKHPAWGLGAKDFLDKVVTGKHPMSASYKILSDQSRRDFIESTIREYRTLAQRQILTDPRNKDFAAEVARLKNEQMNSKMPVLQE